MTPEISVVTCTHNPGSYLAETLQALKLQSLGLDQWELLLIDNASDNPLESRVDLSWHPMARHVQEPKLGLTVARLRGIAESRGEILVFVDDDNLLDPDYLTNVSAIGKEWPKIGTWGAGQIRPKFDKKPPEWTRPYWPHLAVRECDRDSWSNGLSVSYDTPCGAGLCSRKFVAEKYAESVRQDSRRSQLGRIGNSFSSCEDTDLALTACDLELGTGVFKSLQLSHFLPSHRLEKEYLRKLVEGISYSAVMMQVFRGQTPYLPPWWQRLLTYCELYRHHWAYRDLEIAKMRGKSLAFSQLLRKTDLASRLGI